MVQGKKKETSVFAEEDKTTIQYCALITEGEIYLEDSKSEETSMFVEKDK